MTTTARKPGEERDGVVVLSRRGRLSQGAVGGMTVRATVGLGHDYVGLPGPSRTKVEGIPLVHLTIGRGVLGGIDYGLTIADPEALLKAAKTLVVAAEELQRLQQRTNESEED